MTDKLTVKKRYIFLLLGIQLNNNGPTRTNTITRACILNCHYAHS